MFYVCIMTGMAACAPDDAQYVSAETAEELSALVEQARTEFIAEELADGYAEPYLHDFRAPSSAMVTNWQQRIAIGRDHDRVLDVQGMTEDNWLTQTGFTNWEN